MPMTAAQTNRAAALRTAMQKLDPETYQDIRRSYYKIAEELRPLAEALEKADADQDQTAGPLLEEHAIFARMLEVLDESVLGAVV
ncbi:MAG: hypothetical protein HKN47_15990 [Pirellulaceae bacterium]|nr:hypothetical protein [Pirellulaceae bacterium]